MDDIIEPNSSCVLFMTTDVWYSRTTAEIVTEDAEWEDAHLVFVKLAPTRYGILVNSPASHNNDSVELFHGVIGENWCFSCNEASSILGWSIFPESELHQLDFENCALYWLFMQYYCAACSQIYAEDSSMWAWMNDAARSFESFFESSTDPDEAAIPGNVWNGLMGIEPRGDHDAAHLGEVLDADDNDIGRDSSASGHIPPSSDISPTTEERLPDSSNISEDTFHNCMLYTDTSTFQ
ncbi:hypothetical protein BKA93DRAFT_747043 [Sparassis latifolia]